MASREPTWRKRIAGEWSGGLVKLIGFVVLVFIVLPKLLQCAAQAPQIAADMASQTASAVGDAVSNAASNAVDSAADKIKDTACDVTGACASSSSTTAPPPPPANVSTPKRSTCMTVEQAAQKALANARACTHIRKVEFSGNLWVDANGCYASDGPFEGGPDSASTPNIPHPGWMQVANYHSHPMDRPGHFSVTDMCNYIGRPTEGYVVGTDSYSLLGFAWGGSDGQMRHFKPIQGQTFAVDDVRDCLLPHSAWSTLGLWTCPDLDASLDTNPRGVGTVTRILPDLPRTADAPCRYAEPPAPMGPPPPPMSEEQMRLAEQLAEQKAATDRANFIKSCTH